MRSWRTLALVLVLCGGLAPLSTAADRLAPASTPGQSVAMFRGGPARTGENPGPGPHGKPTVRWRTRLGFMISGSPAVAGGVVYVGSLAPLIRPGDALHALDAVTGDELWNLPTVDGDGFLSSPAVVDGTVYIGSYYGFVLSADAVTGEERWRFQAAAAVLSSPAVAGGTVYVGDTAGNLYALDAATGEPRWRVNSDQSWERYFSSSPAVVDGTVYVVDNARRVGRDSGLVALDGETGAEHWRFVAEEGGILRGTPAVADGAVYVTTTEGYLHVVDAETGHERWHLNIPGPVRFTNPAVVDGVVILANSNGELHLIDVNTRQERWTRRLTKTSAFFSSPTVAGGTVYVADSVGILYALDVASGDERWRFGVGSFYSSPAVVGGMVYIGGERGELVALGDPEEELP